MSGGVDKGLETTAELRAQADSLIENKRGQWPRAPKGGPRRPAFAMRASRTAKPRLTPSLSFLH
jgi:hypothetical protein